MKRFFVLLFSICFCFSLVACGGSDSLNAEADNDVAALTPVTDLPEYSAAFQAVLDNVDVDEEALKNYMGYAIAAYNTYDEKEFCKYMSDEIDNAFLTELTDDIAAKANELTSDNPSAESFDISMKLQEVNFKMLLGVSGIASCNSDYAQAVADKNDNGFADLKDDYVFYINTIANQIYGCDILG